MKGARLLVGAAVVLTGCDLFDTSGPEVEVPTPDFGGLALPDLRGEIVVTDGAGTAVASASLSVEGNSARGIVPGLAPGVDLQVTVRWTAAAVGTGYALVRNRDV